MERKMDYKIKRKLMRKNIGFSMVELIIVIAIMAILAAALAPQMIKYVKKSRKTTDINNADELHKCVELAFISMSSKTDEAEIGTGTLLLRYDDTVNNPKEELEDYIVEETGGIPVIKTHRNYYWKVLYDNTTGKVSYIYITNGDDSDEGYQLYSYSEEFLEGNTQ